MRLIALEEHYRSQRVNEEIGEAGNYFRSMNSAGKQMAQQRLVNLGDLGERRIADMDRAGIDLQVLSHTHPSPEILEPTRAIPLCRLVNDESPRQLDVTLNASLASPRCRWPIPMRLRWSLNTRSNSLASRAP
ncbi:MAG: hypothetical protein ABSH09_22065 [Bryobacteraceae bacterium]|jgi:hypothetical protein